MSFSRYPQRVTDEVWYYERTKGIEISYEIYDDNDGYTRTRHVTIPWKMVRRSLARKDHKKVRVK